MRTRQAIIAAAHAVDAAISEAANGDQPAHVRKELGDLKDKLSAILPYVTKDKERNQ